MIGHTYVLIHYLMLVGFEAAVSHLVKQGLASSLGSIKSQVDLIGVRPNIAH